LWSGLRGRRLQGHKFIRQHSIGPFTVDFLCRDAALIIEVDGATHSGDRDLEYDARRTAYLGSQGYRVLRILNDDVFHRFNDVMDMILLALADKLPPD
jgi:very-short-patch-repair endonuclease